jgi:transcriptional activator protein UGA3
MAIAPALLQRRSPADPHQSTFIFIRKPILQYTGVSAFSRPASDKFHTLTGVSLPLFCKISRIAALVRQRHSKRNGAWSDDDLVDMVRSAEELETELAEDKTRMDALVICEFTSYRFLTRLASS